MCVTPADVRDLRKRRLLCKQEFGPEEERAYQSILSQYREELDPIEEDIADWLARQSDEDLSSLQSVRSSLESEIDLEERRGAFRTVFREGGEEGIRAGREIAARTQELGIDWDIVPERTIDRIDDWVDVAADSTLETITDDASHWLRGAHEEGLGIDDIAGRLNTELYDDRLEGYVAERAARTATVSTSNVGNHSALEDSSAVAERWLAELDGRQRDSHEDAHGQVVVLDNTFEVGGSNLEHPGDPSAPLDELANCRCTVVGVWPDELTADQLERLENGERIYLS